MRLKQRLERIETVVSPANRDRVTEIHRVIVGMDGSPMIGDDGQPVVFVRRLQR